MKNYSKHIIRAVQKILYNIQHDTSLFTSQKIGFLSRRVIRDFVSMKFYPGF